MESHVDTEFDTDCFETPRDPLSILLGGLRMPLSVQALASSLFRRPHPTVGAALLKFLNETEGAQVVGTLGVALPNEALGDKHFRRPGWFRRPQLGCQAAVCVCFTHIAKIMIKKTNCGTDGTEI
jgi:hypothetical protein